MYMLMSRHRVCLLSFFAERLLLKELFHLWGAHGDLTRQHPFSLPSWLLPTVEYPARQASNIDFLVLHSSLIDPAQWFRVSSVSNVPRTDPLRSCLEKWGQLRELEVLLNILGLDLVFQT